MEELAIYIWGVLIALSLVGLLFIVFWPLVSPYNPDSNQDHNKHNEDIMSASNNRELTRVRYWKFTNQKYENLVYYTMLSSGDDEEDILKIRQLISSMGIPQTFAELWESDDLNNEKAPDGWALYREHKRIGIEIIYSY